MAHRLGTRACSPYTCACGKAVDAIGLHGLSCKRSTPRHQRHSMINDVIWRAIKREKIPTHKEPTGLILSDGKRSDGATLIPWSRGKATAWDVTVSDTYAASHLQSTAFEACSAAKHAAVMKCTKYQELEATHLFFPIAIETAGTWDKRAMELIEKIYRRCTIETDDQRETAYLYERNPSRYREETH